MLTERQRCYLLHGPGANEHKRDVLKAFDGPCALLVKWRRHRQELLDACPPGKRPWGYWLIEKRLKQRPAGEAGELRTIRMLGCYRNDAERRYVLRRLSEITEAMHQRRHLSRVA
jgi:hypothetical protein